VRSRATIRRIVVCLALALLTAFVYGGTSKNGYINFDDPEYVSKNPVVRQGLTWQGLAWALRSTEQANWHPLTWWSHMLDASLFGDRPGPQHLVSALLHATAAALLFLSLEAMTGAPWPSALVAALFAAHPLHVESVAWIAERKDVLCALFWMLALYAYSRHARKPGAAGYLAVTACFALALMAKPMAMTLPLALLLLDWWPLGRRSFLEKVPLLALSLISGVVTLAVQSAGGAVTARHPFGLRLENALVSTAVYQVKLLWPQRLGVFYHHPGASLPGWQWPLAGCCLAAVTLAVVRLRRRHPWLATGWAWYLATLAPVSGLVQVGEQGMADRYAYLPSVGLTIALVWWAADLPRRSPVLRAAVPAAAVSAVVALGGVAREQAGRWRDSETLFRHTLAVAGESSLLRTNLGGALLDLERWEDALREFDIALRANPNDEVAWFNTGIASGKLQRWARAETAFRRVVAANPADRKALYNLGIALAKQQRWAEAMEVYRALVMDDPGDREARFNLGMIAVTLGDRETAVEQQAALESISGRDAANLRAFIEARGW
jgi:Tfp pilus assembly protein PilF